MVYSKARCRMLKTTYHAEEKSPRRRDVAAALRLIVFLLTRNMLGVHSAPHQVIHLLPFDRKSGRVAAMLTGGVTSSRDVCCEKYLPVAMPASVFCKRGRWFSRSCFCAGNAKRDQYFKEETRGLGSFVSIFTNNVFHHCFSW